ncbi:MAG: hypothetical protein KAS32_30625 [Candidatus Peribacteraceae bacterium]|nr:hypothetical protein [Candidatus Peribacteraceae bacterium]
MNDEERQYWINILPIMTTEQIDNLKGILDNERKQLKAIDKKYAKKVKEIGDEEQVVKTQHKIKEQRDERRSKEEEAEKSEETEIDSVLSKIEDI